MIHFDVRILSIWADYIHNVQTFSNTMQMNRVLIEYSYECIIPSEQQPGLVSKDAGNVSGSHRR